MTGKRLIVNADDYNTDAERNRGIVQAAKEGIVTSVSVIANLPLIEKDIVQLQEVFGARVGVHLNLTRGIPLTPHSRTLAGKDSRFLPKREAWSRALFRGYDVEEVKQEFAAQISRLKEAGLSPDHLDGNNHLHVFPGIAEVVAQLANDFQISKIRLPLEPFDTWRQYYSAGVWKKALVGWFAAQARPLFKRCGLRFPDRCAGIQSPRVCEIESLRTFLRNLPEGSTELMCHPGYPNEPVNAYSTVERQEELLALTDWSIGDYIRHSDIKPISFQDLE